MKYFLDTEFIERGLEYPIELISIGIVAEDGREFYAVADWWVSSHASEWVLKNVIMHLGNHTQSSRFAIVEGIRAFIGEDKPEFWGYYADYDWVVFCQLFGAMIDLPKGWPMFCRDIKQLCIAHGNPQLPKQDSTEHNALCDARWNKQAYAAILSYAEQAEGERAAQIRDWFESWRPCDCGFPKHKYNTECGHAINCDAYTCEELIRALALSPAPPQEKA